MTRKIKKIPKGTILIHYTKNGKVVSDLDLRSWGYGLVAIIDKAIQLNSTLLVKIGTENMVNTTRRLIIRGLIDHNKIRYRYGRRIFRIDCNGRFMGVAGKNYPKNFLGMSRKMELALPDAPMEGQVEKPEKKNFYVSEFMTVQTTTGTSNVSLNGKQIAEPTEYDPNQAYTHSDYIKAVKKVNSKPSKYVMSGEYCDPNTKSQYGQTIKTITPKIGSGLYAPNPFKAHHEVLTEEQKQLIKDTAGELVETWADITPELGISKDYVEGFSTLGKKKIKIKKTKIPDPTLNEWDEDEDEEDEDY